jgi:hypothetical protein
MVSGRYFNRGVMALDTPHIGHVVRETDDKIVVFGGGKERYDIPVSEIQTTGRNVLIGLTLHEIMKRYRVTREAPLTTSRPLNPWTYEKDVDLATFEGSIQGHYLTKELELKMRTI